MDSFNPLLRSQITGKDLGELYTVLIGYREVTLVGTNGQDVIGNKIYINQGETVPQNILICADTLYFQSGATYDFQGKSVVIVARRVGLAGDNGQPAVFDVKGKKGPDPVQDLALPQTPEKAAPGRKDVAGIDEREQTRGHDGTDGTPGVDGKLGFPGENAGGFTMTVFELLDNLNLIVDATGGDGGDGGSGGMGGRGGDGGDGGTFLGMVNDLSSYGGPGGKAGNGGRGGFFGWGGTAGKGGLVQIWSVRQCPTTVKLEGKIEGGSPGKQGDPGLGGLPGLPGEGGDGSRSRGEKGATALPGYPGDVVTVERLLKDPRPDYLSPDELRGGVDLQYEINLEDFVAELSSAQIEMTLDRLRYTLLMKLSLGDFQPTDNSDDDSTIRDLKETLDWLNEIVSAVNSSPHWNAIISQLQVINKKINNKMDYYGDISTFIPIPNIDVAQLESDISKFGSNIEYNYQTLLKYAAEREKSEIDLKIQMETLSDQIAKDTSSLDGYRADLVTAEQSIVKAMGEVQTAYQKWSDDLLNQIDALANEISWSGGQLLSALGSILMFAGPEFAIAKTASQAYAAGGILSVGSAFNFTQTEIAGVPVDTKYFVAQANNVRADIGSIKDACKGDPTGLLIASDGNMMLLGKQQEFDNYFSDKFPDTNVKTEFDEYMSAIQKQNQALLDYNKVIVKLLSARADLQTSENALALKEGTQADLNDPDLSELLRIAAYIYNLEMSELLYLLYAAGRAYICLSLKPCSALKSLAGLQSLASLTSSELNTAITLLKKDLTSYVDDIGSVNSDVITITLMPTNEANTRRLNSLRENRRVTLTFIPDMDLKTYHGLQDLEPKTDIRVIAVKAYLVGASVPSGSTEIQMNVTSPGHFAVEKWYGEAGFWEFDTILFQRSNTYTLNADGTFHDKPGISDNTITQLKWGGGDGARTITAPLYGIYAAWTVSLGTLEVNMDDVTALQLEFTIQYRARER
jgi:hypothetical protein